MWRTVKNVQTESSKRKKRVKWIFITFWLFVWFLVCCWLRAVISRFTRDINYEKYNRKNPKCYEKCKKAYKGNEREPWMYVEHLNHCESACIQPKWDSCIENCKKTTLWEELKWEYNYENYENWLKNKYKLDSWDWNFSPMTLRVKQSRTMTFSEIPLKEEKEYTQWINEVFSWYQNEIKNYELCEDSCGPAPEYTHIN